MKEIKIEVGGMTCEHCLIKLFRGGCIFCYQPETVFFVFKI